MAIKYNKSRLEYMVSLLLALALFFTVLYSSGKALVAGVIIFVVLLQKKHSFIDSNFVMLSLALFFYISNMLIFHNGDYFLIPIMIFPPVAYLIGGWIGSCCKTDGNFLNAQILIGISLSFFTVLSVVINIYDYGFAGLSRSIEIIGLGDSEYNATVAGGFLILLTGMAGVSLCVDSKMTTATRIIIFVLAIFGITAALRLGSRTHLLIFFTSMLAGYWVNKESFGLYRKVILYVVALGLFFYVSKNLNDEALFLSYFADRINNTDVGAATFGGRLERWTMSIDRILSNPGGWSFGEIGYAHNLWLDTARAGGWWSLFMLTLFTATAIATLYNAFKCNHGLIFRTTLVCLALSFFLIFSVEPILDGFVYPFSVFCTFLGCVKGYSKECLRSKVLSRVV